MPPPKPEFAKKHPYGLTLLSRDKPENRAQWGPTGIGYVDVAPSVCAGDGGTTRCPHYHYRKDATREGGATVTPIHLLIASYRDRLCPRTLHNAFSHAENPSRIFIRVIEQSEPNSDLIDDAGCWDRYCKDFNQDCKVYEDNVRTVHVDATKAKGPTDARSKLSAMVNWDYVHRDDPTKLDFERVELNDFCMQTDSHMDFSDSWDTELIFMHHRTQNDYAVLSTYVASIDQNNQDIRNPVPNLCMVTFTSTIRNWGTKECRNLVRPKLTNAMWGAGLSFHRCHAELNVPVDPYLDGVFDGEEGSRGLRFFTHGYDVYTPDRVLVTHDYDGHQHNPVVHTWGRHAKSTEMDRVWSWREDIERERAKIKTIGTQRVNMMLGIGRQHYSPKEREEQVSVRGSRFGIGTRRTLEQASEFSGIDLAGKKMVENKCGNLVWVPFEESPGGDYGVGEALKRGLARAEDAAGSADPADPAAAAASIRGAAAAGGSAAAAALASTRRDLRPIDAEMVRDAGGSIADARAEQQQQVAGSPPRKHEPSIRFMSPIVVAAAVASVLLVMALAKSSGRRKKGDKHKN